MIDGHRGVGLTHEPLAVSWIVATLATKELQRDELVRIGVVRRPDDAHPALAQESVEAIAAVDEAPTLELLALGRSRAVASLALTHEEVLSKPVRRDWIPAGISESPDECDVRSADPSLPMSTLCFIPPANRLG